MTYGFSKTGYFDMDTNKNIADTRPEDEGFQLHEKQIEALRIMTDPVARHSLLLGGARSGKTLLCVWSIFIRMMMYPRSRHLSMRLFRADAERYLWRQTMRDVVNKCFSGVGFEFNNSRMIVTAPNGSEYWFAGLDKGDASDGILGSEWNTVHYDEANEMQAEAMQTARTRLALRTWNEDRTKLCVNRTFATVNPTYKTHHLYRTYVEKHDVFQNLPMPAQQAQMYNWFRINPVDNLDNLGEDYMIELQSLSPSHRKRFMEGEWSEESKDALFKLADINRNRIGTKDEIDAIQFDKIIVAVDPAVSLGEHSDMTGIVVVGWTRPPHGSRRSSGQYYILEDRSLRGTPDEWAQEVYSAYQHWRADEVVGEVNNGGDLVEKNIRSVSRTVPYRKVWATRGKAIRAQPVVALNERGDLHIAVSLPELEGEMVGWNPNSNEPSPNRLDAMVWGVSACMGNTYKEAMVIAI